MYTNIELLKHLRSWKQTKKKNEKKFENKELTDDELENVTGGMAKMDSDRQHCHNHYGESTCEEDNHHSCRWKDNKCVTSFW